MGKSSEEKAEAVAPSLVTLKEMHERLPWFEIDVSLQALRQTLRELRIEPRSTALGRSGRGRTAYYDFAALWVLATAYHAAYSPKTKLAEVAMMLANFEAGQPQAFSISEFFTPEQPTKVSRLPHDVHAAYLAFVCDDGVGLDLRIVTKVAREHWSDVGLDNETLAWALTRYKARVLRELGVPQEEAARVSLRG